MITRIPLFKAPPHQVTYPLGYWKTDIEALAYKNILRLKDLHGFTEKIIKNVFERNAAIKRMGFTQN